MKTSMYLILIISQFTIYSSFAQYPTEIKFQPENMADKNEQTFAKALMDGNFTLAEEMINLGVNPDCLVPASNNSYYTSLQIAYLKNNYDIMTLLVKWGADINKSYYHKGGKVIFDNAVYEDYAFWYTLLTHAVKKNNLLMTKELLKRGAIAHNKVYEKNALEYVPNYSTELKKVIEDRLMDEKKVYYSVIAKKENATAKKLFSLGLDAVDSLIFENAKKTFTPIEFAIYNENEEFARFLVRNNAYLLNRPFLSQQAHQKSMPQLAVLIDSAVSAQKILAEKDNISKALKSDDLELYKKAVIFLKQRSDSLLNDDLLKACENSSYKIAEHLIEKGVKIENKYFDVAVLSPNPENLMELLIKKGGEIPESAFVSACIEVKEQVVRIFIQHGYNPLTYKDKKGQNIIFQITKEKHPLGHETAYSNIIKMLAEKGVDINQTIDTDLATPLMHMVKKSGSKMVKDFFGIWFRSKYSELLRRNCANLCN
jgi:ankyrin repeat protein